MGVLAWWCGGLSKLGCWANKAFSRFNRSVPLLRKALCHWLCKIFSEGVAGIVGLTVALGAILIVAVLFAPELGLGDVMIC
jgi:hypothetical protein